MSVLVRAFLDMSGVGAPPHGGGLGWSCPAGPIAQWLRPGAYAEGERALFDVVVVAPPPVPLPGVLWTVGSVVDPDDPNLALGAWAAAWQQGGVWYRVIARCPGPQEARRAELAAFAWVAVAPSRLHRLQLYR